MLQAQRAVALTDLSQCIEQAEGWSAVLAALRAGRAGTIDGAWGSAAALVTATLAAQAPGPVLVLLAHPGDVDAWADDLSSFGATPALLPAAAPETLGARLKLLKALRDGTARGPILATCPAVLRPVPSPAALARLTRQLRVGMAVDLENLLTWLVEHGQRRREVAELPGDCARRGGLLDVFPVDATHPIRIEFFGDEISSLRAFDPATQRSMEPLEQVELTALDAVEPGMPPAAASPAAGPPTAPFSDYLPAQAWVVLVEPAEIRDHGQHFLRRLDDQRGWFSLEALFAQLIRWPSVTVTSLPHGSAETTCHLRVESVERFRGRGVQVQAELTEIAAQGSIVIACPTAAEVRRLREVLGNLPGLHLVQGHVRAGFRLVEAGVTVVGAQELFHRADEPRRRTPQRAYESRAIDSFLDLAEDDLVVHLSHGIARYRGIHVLEHQGHWSEHLLLEFAEGTKLYVPTAKIDLVQKYVGGAHAPPELSKLGSSAWLRRKEKVQAAVMDLAAEMLDLQARRAAEPGLAYPPDSTLQKEFEASFPYAETPDQEISLAEIKRDMEQPRPMDRLICGDVGYGKTELALRAAFKAADNGKQVAVLVPTTVLAEQHLRTFSGRLAAFPVTVACLNRFRSSAEQKRILQRLSDGSLDIVIGTHRLLSHDVRFKDLGLVIIDEEQRFGVEHKEKLKALRATVDVLTLTATPIPRTLHQSLLGIRDISNLATPPRDRIATETRIVRHDPAIIRHAVLRELNREGQCYFVHNRVHDIAQIAARLQQIVPEARLGIGHGQMTGAALESVMLDFVERRIDILVATTIIESGLDIPNCNTIFIHQADQYGLADLHQLRGRVGRSHHRAYCYLLLEPAKPLSEIAAQRLKAIEEFTELGAGFKIAMRDLEIRGAGNILGTQQSGHIAAVGYELYCQLLEQAIQKLRREPVRQPLDVSLELPWPGHLPQSYLDGPKAKIEVYRRLSRVQALDRLADFRTELQDRFGPLPEPVDWLLRQQEIRILAARWKIASLHRDGDDLVFGYRDAALMQTLAERAGVQHLGKHRPPLKRLRIVDGTQAYWSLLPGERAPAGMYTALCRLLSTAAPARAKPRQPSAHAAEPQSGVA